MASSLARRAASASHQRWTPPSPTVGLTSDITAAASSDSASPSPEALAPADAQSSSGCPHDDTVHLHGQTLNGQALYRACLTLTAGPDLTLDANADITFEAGQQISLQPGFRVAAGAVLKARVGALTPDYQVTG